LKIDDLGKSMKDLILVTGVTGYVGGRLVPRLLAEGYHVRCMVRDADRLRGYSWLDQVETVEADALVPASLGAALQGVSTAYYLIHGMQGGDADPDRDLVAAHKFAVAAQESHLDHIIYLGELADPAGDLSPYLRSRHDTGQVLRDGQVPVTELRAGMIVGAGSILFEMIRYLAERQPVFICPRWWFTQAQPIAIGDVLDYMIAALRTGSDRETLIEIGGVTRISYARMLLGYSKERGLRRFLIPVPFIAPRLSAYWVHMVTPVHWRVILPLIQGLSTESLVRSDLAKQLFPGIQPMDFQAAIRLALGAGQNGIVETFWSDALVVTQGDKRPVLLTTTEGMFLERRQLSLEVDSVSVFRSYTGLGGDRGWLYLNWTWQVRGWFDKLLGGVGLRRGRRDPDELRVGEALDFWRVEAIDPGSLLRLRAEMKVPGEAWLEFRSTLQEDGRTLLTQTAYFAARGLAGFLYWYLLYPIHGFIFRGMIRKVAERAHLLARA
jgi:uncharacterized protein YbjT (DUF2867 family)